MRKKFVWVIFIAVLLTFSLASALVLPENIQKISEYNKAYSSNFLLKISLPIAFIAGLISFIAPCTLALFPAFFSYTFKEKKEITKMSLVFFFGFALTFVAMGLIAGLIGQTATNLIPNKGAFILIAGLFLIFLGALSIFGKGIASFIKIRKNPSHDIPGMFLFGIFFAVGWTACTGPILAGILSIAALAPLAYSGLLLFVYALGIAAPFFIFSIFYDKFDISRSPIIAGKEFELNLFGKKLKVHSTNLIAGLILILLGALFLIFQGTQAINTLNPFGALGQFYDWQRGLIK